MRPRYQEKNEETHKALKKILQVFLGPPKMSLMLYPDFMMKRSQGKRSCSMVFFFIKIYQRSGESATGLLLLETGR